MLPPEDQCLPPMDIAEHDLTPSHAGHSLDAATPVQTASGVQRLDALIVGQRVLTRAGTLNPITRIEHLTLTKRQLHDNPDIAPIRFDPGALPGMPDETATLISPDCPIAWADGATGSDKFPARAFCDGGLIRWVMPDEGIHYIQVFFATTQQIDVGGIWVELTAGDRMPCAAVTPVPKPATEIRMFRPLHT